MHSLRVKLTAVTITAILASLLSFALASFFTVGRETDASSAEKMHLLSENAQQSLDGYLHNVEHAVNTTARIENGALDSLALVEFGVNKDPSERTPEQTKSLDAYLTEHCTHMQEVYASIATHTSGIITYYYCINPEVSTTEHGFFYSKLGKVGFEEQEPLDARELDPNDLEHTTWYYTPIERGEPVWVGPYKAHFLGEVLTVSYLTPIYKAGTLIGVLGMDMLLQTMVEHVDSVEVYQTGYACLLDKDGKVLHHPKLAMGDEPEFYGQLFKEDGLSQASSGSQLLRYDDGSMRWQLAYSTLLNGMKLVVTAPVNEAMASYRHLLTTIPIIALVVLALLTPATPLVLRAIIRPLQQLTVAAHKLAEGDYDIELDYTGKDEVGELTDSFRRLRDHLQVYIIDLSSPTFIDPLTGVKNQSAFDIYVTRLDDTIVHSKGSDELQFALLKITCTELSRINAEFGHERGDAHLRETCSLACKVYERSPVFRLSGDDFIVLLQGKDYANRDELLADFAIRADMQNSYASDPWLRIETVSGMATFDPNEDNSMTDVLRRADRNTQERRT